MKIKLIGIFISITFYCNSQVLVKETIEINPFYSQKDSIKAIRTMIKIRFAKNDATTTIKLELSNINYNSKLELIHNELNVTNKGNGKENKTKDSITVEYPLDLLLYNTTNQLKGDELAALYLANDSNKENPVFLRLTEKGLYQPNKSFWIELGSNFDLIDGLQSNNLFSGIFVHKKDIRSLNKKSKNIGFFAGVYESKAISIIGNDEIGIREYYTKNSQTLVNPKVKPGEYGGFRDSARIKSSQVVRNLGLFLSPQLRLTNGSANKDGLHLFVSLWIELQWQRVQLDKEYTGLTRIDTFSIPKSSLYKYTLDIGNQTNSISTNTVDLRSHYYGIGLPILFKEGKTNVFINPVIGFSNQPKSTLDLNTFSELQSTRNWGWFYAFQFRLNEETYGLSLTGEVRGLTITNSPPIISLALSKKFDLSRLLLF